MDLISDSTINIILLLIFYKYSKIQNDNPNSLILHSLIITLISHIMESNILLITIPYLTILLLALIFVLNLHPN
jgi:hypothetical protein